ncbi:serine hydrolase [candidate division KSB1 bacterium]|nr:serine hydrolase [candidate division KSB1 bacterium]
MESRIQSSFERQVQKDKNIRSAYLLVNSEKYEIDLQIAKCTTVAGEADIHQPNYMASVGKLFTATIIGMLYEKGQLDFSDCISKHLDAEIVNRLHVFKGNDYSTSITIRHLLMQTSGLYDVFYHLLNKMIKEPQFTITPREAILWGKENLTPVGIPGKKHVYTDTNYHLLGLIIENITGKAFHDIMHEFVFDRVGMQHAYMYGFSKPRVEADYTPSKAYINGQDILAIGGYHQIDYAGGCVIAPLSEYLLFMKALVNHAIIKRETLDRMLSDEIAMGFPLISFNYGYSIWKLRSIPLLIPEAYRCWGCAGATGAFMFYHPATKSYIIGTFNDFSYRGKALQFMAKKVIKQLVGGSWKG